MGIFDKKNIIKIDAEDVKDAKLSSSGFPDGSLKQRAFVDVLGARLAMKSLFSQKIEANNFYSLYSIHSVLKELDIADIYFQGIKIDVRLVFNQEEIFIPKSHFEYDLLPDVYVVLQLKEDFSAAEFLGYFEPQDINKENENKDYYFYESDKLHNPQDLKDFLESFIVEDHFKSTEEDAQRAEDLFLEFIDKEISQQNKLFLLKQLANNVSLREKIVEFENFELMSAQVAKRPELLQDQFLDIIGAQQVVEKDPLTKSEVNSELAAAGIIAAAGATAGAAGAAVGIAGVMAAANAKSVLPDIGSVNISPEINFGSETSEISDELTLEELDKSDIEEDELNDLFSEFETEKADEKIENEVPLDDLDLDAFTADEETKDEAGDGLDALDELVGLEDLEDLEEEGAAAVEEDVEDEELTALNELADDEENDNDDIDNDEVEDNQLDEITAELGTLEELPPLEELDELESFDESGSEETEADDEQSLEDENEVSPEAEESDLTDEDEDKDDVSNLADFDTLGEESKIATEEMPNEFDDNVVSFDEMVAQDEPKKDKDALEKFNELEAEEEAGETASTNAASKDDSDEFISQVDDFLNDIELSDEQKSLVEEELGSDIDLDDILSELPEADSKTAPVEAELKTETTTENTDTTNKDSAKKDSDLLQVLFNNENNEAAAQTDLTQADFANIKDAQGTITEGDFANIDFTKQSSPFSNLAKNKRMIIAASLATVVLAAVVVGGVTKHNQANNLNKPPAVEQAANPQDPNSDITSQIPEQSQAQPGDEGQLNAQEQPSIPGDAQATAPKRDMNKAVSDAFLSEPVNATISKVAWEVPEDLAYNDSFRKYLQMAGKNLKLNLQNELLLATEMAYSNKVVLDMEVTKDGNVQSSNVTISSGSKQIDKIVLQSVKETLKYLKMPSDDVNRPSVPVTLIINF